MPLPELNSPDFSTWFGAPMALDPENPGIFHGSPNEGITLTEVLYVQNPRAQGKRRGESWSAVIRVVIPDGEDLETSLQAGGFDINNIRLLGLLKSDRP